MSAPELLSDAPDAVLRFGDFEVDMRRAEVTRDGAPINLRPKTFVLLCYLARRSGRVLSRNELVDHLWPGVVVTHDSLTQCVNELRAALGDREQHVIKTVPRQGYRFDAAVTHRPHAAPGAAEETLPPCRPSRASVLATAGGALALAAFVAGGLALHPSEKKAQGIDAELAQRRSLAVLPFADLSDPKTPHLAEGVTEEVITDVGRMPNTLVIARASAAVAGRGSEVDVREAGRRLGVQHVVTGSVTSHGERVQVTAQLARADTGAVLWTERFAYERASDWNWRLDISRRIAATLNVALHRVTVERAETAGRSGEGITHLLQGQFIYKASQSRAQMIAAREHFEAAVRAEPGSVNALAGLSLTHVCLVLFRWSDDREADIAAAKSAAKRALAIDAEHPVALRAMGQALLFAGEFDESGRTFDRMIEVSPNNPDAYRGKAAVLYLSGQWDRVEPYVQEALKLSPLDAANLWRARDILAGALFGMGRDQAALEQWRMAVEANPSVPHLHFALAAAQALLGHVPQARKSVAAGLALSPGYSVAHARTTAPSSHPLYVERVVHRQQEGLRLAKLPEGAVEAAAPSMPQGTKR